MAAYSENETSPCYLTQVNNRLLLRAMQKRRILKHPDGTPYSKEERRVHRNALVRERRKCGPVIGRAPRRSHAGMTEDEAHSYRNQLKRERWARDEAFRLACKVSHKKWEKENPDLCKQRKRRASYRYNYGASWEEYQAKLLVQNGRCGICQTTDPGNARAKTFAFDHCHKTGKPRMLLCHSCNLGLGLFKDDPDLTERATRYLRSFTQVLRSRE